MFPHMCPVYIILHGNPLLWTPNPPITSCIHQTFTEQFPGAPDGWVSACTQLPLTTPASASPYLAAGGFGWLGRRHTSVVYVNVPTLVWLRGIRVHETVSSASLPVQRASLQTKAVCSENNEEGVCWGGRGSHRKIKPQGDGGKRHVPCPHQPETESWSNTFWEGGACRVRNWLGRGGVSQGEAVGNSWLG